MSNKYDYEEVHKGLNTKQAPGNEVNILPHFGGSWPWQVR